MKRNSLSSKLLRTSIVVTAILILIVFSMFFQYYMKIQKTIQDEQMRMLSENVTARADSAFVSLDDISTYTYRSFGIGLLGESCASSVILCVIVMVLTFIFNRYLTSKEVEA